MSRTGEALTRTSETMKILAAGLLLLVSCKAGQPAERYGFVALLGRDTVSIESVTRHPDKLISDEVDRFPKLRRRHTEIDLDDNGAITRLVMDIHTPGEPENQRDRRVEAEVTNDTVRLTKKDGTGTRRYTFASGGDIAMPHLPQMYSLYELYFDAALKRAATANGGSGDRIQMRQFYIDREFDRFPLHRGYVTPRPNGKAEIRHDWLSGTGEATLDSDNRLLRYSGAGTTYKVEVRRVNEQPDVKAIAARFAAIEANTGAAKALSPRDTTRSSVGSATFEIDYGRPLTRGRSLLGEVIQYGSVWRTGANAATQFTTSAPITLAGLAVPAGKYTLWTIPREGGVELVVNKQTGQWGTGYNPAHDLGRAAMATDSSTTPVEAFTISIRSESDRRGTLVMEWGSFRWSAPIVVQ